MIREPSKLARCALKALDYARYSILALDAGVPWTRVPALRRAANLVHALGYLDCRSSLKIIDVGAHCGEWGKACARALRRCEILSFEPVPEFCQQARRRAARFPRWKVVQLALGREQGQMPMEVRGQRSSLKRLAGEGFPDWVEGNTPLERVETVAVGTLDRVVEEEAFLPVDLLKIDAEGFEKEILLGAEKTLKNTKQVLIEVRFYQLFESGSSFFDVHEILGAFGFVLMHLKACQGQCVWADALYLRNSDACLDRTTRAGSVENLPDERLHPVSR